MSRGQLSFSIIKPDLGRFPVEEGANKEAFTRFEKASTASKVGDEQSILTRIRFS
jgi:hypothetical protein